MPSSKDISLVIETTEAKGDQTLALQASSDQPAEPLHVWRTDMMEQFIPQPDLGASNGTWTLTLNPNCTYSLTTTTGQGKGTTSSPPPSPFPLPYGEGFEGYQLSGTPRYLSDMGGAFEVVAREGGGQCLRQQVHRSGIDWAKASYAYSAAGNASSSVARTSVRGRGGRGCLHAPLQ